MVLTDKQEALCAQSAWDFSDLRALFVSCTLKRSPEVSNTEGLAAISMEIMQKNGVAVDLGTTPLRPDESRQDAQQGGLARAVGTEDGEGVTGFESKGDAVEGANRAERVLQALSPQHRCGRRARSGRTV